MKNNYILKRLAILCLIAFSFSLTACGAKTNENASGGTSSIKNKDNTAAMPLEKGKNDKNPIVTIEMEDGGKIKLELYPETAPNTVRNFVTLVQKGFYDGLIFHRVIPGFMIQGGDPKGTGIGGPGYSIKGEFTSNGFTNNLKHERGVISMARSSSPNSAGSQFFIMVKATPSLDGQYASFGKVTEGMEEVDKIVSIKRDENDKPITDVKMKKVTVETFGVKYNEPQKQ